MKGKLLLTAAIAALLIPCLPACNAVTPDQPDYSLKSLSRPYIAQYECKEARLGGENLLKSFEYIKIIFLNAEEFELAYKPVGGEKKIYSGNYSVDPVSRELEADITILGHRLKGKTKVENGKFSIQKTLGGKELYVLFESK